MPPILSALASRLSLTDAIRERSSAPLALIVLFQLAALAVMAWSEIELLPMAAFPRARVRSRAP